MKRIILALGLSLVCSIVLNAQQSQSQTQASGDANSQTTAMANAPGKTINLDSGTSLSGQLQNSIDARNAKIGDQVLLKTTKAIKSGGETVVNKGSRLVGHITEVAQKTKNNGESRIAILFDRLEQGTLQTPIATTITSITSANTNAQVGNDDMFANGSTGGSTRSSSSTSSAGAGNGGLLGGVGNVVGSTTSTVGNVVGSSTSAVGTTVDSTTSAARNTTSGVGKSLGGIQISQASSTTVEGSSVLSLQGGNLRLEKGTNFNLVLTQSTSAGAAKNQ